MKNIKYFLPLLVFVAVALFFWQGLKQDPHELQSALIGKAMPTFEAADLMKEEETLTQEMFLGEVSLLNVWATWCPACYAGHAVMMDIASKDDVIIYGLNYKDNQADAQKWIQTHGDPYQAIIYDPKGLLAIDLGVYGTPESFIIDKKGVIRYKHIGVVSPNVWDDTIKPVIERLSNE